MLALALGGRSVEEWKVAITPAAFQRWVAFYTLFPFDDFHRFHRPAALVATSFAGGEIGPRLDWLQPDSSTAELSETDIGLMKLFGVTKKAG